MRSALGLALIVLLAAGTADAQGIIGEWASVRPPSPPKLQTVTMAPKTTALLVLDLAEQTCSPTARPRCRAMLPHVATLIARAREKGWAVIYTIGAASQPADILPPVARREGEPVFKGPPDKFVGTGLEAELKRRGIETVVAVGSAAEGAVLETAASAAFRGFNVVVPVDGMASGSLYAEQYVAWDLVNAPGVSARARLSAIDEVQ